MAVVARPQIKAEPADLTVERAAVSLEEQNERNQWLMTAQISSIPPLKNSFPTMQRKARPVSTWLTDLPSQWV